MEHTSSLTTKSTAFRTIPNTMTYQQPAKSTTFVYPNKLERGEGVDHNGVTVGEWSNAFFNCCDDFIPNGLMAFLCPVISVAQITVRLGLSGYPFILGMHVMLYLSGLVAAVSGDPLLLLLCAAAEILTTVSISRLRVKVRSLFSIPGNVLEDAALAVLCRPCAIAQMATHVHAYSAGKCMFRARRSPQPGRNFAAGMSGGIAYIYDEDNSFQKKCNMGMVGVGPLTETASDAEIQEVKALVTKHLERTQSPKAQKLLDNWDASAHKFMRVMPYDYERVLLQSAAVVKETKKSASVSA